jgi:UDP-N-acetylmuramoyl-L-alanyl-D-glutamate--2,6-diaminopimelate ligase
MAKVAETLADRIIVTSDNPRTEDPLAIIEQILPGFSPAGRARAEVLPDRREAIARAVELAEAGDVIVIAGKGHENYQVVGRRKVPFDDVQVAAELVRRRGGRP